jgi:phosphotransferase system  glucose/maltose/N-acetylglucosamine-specific IIC component
LSPTRIAEQARECMDATMVSHPSYEHANPADIASSSSGDPLNRALGIVALAGLAAMIVICLVVQWRRSDLNWLAVPLSMYLEGPYGAWVQASFFALAPGVVALAIGSYRALGKHVCSVISMALFIIAAVALCVMASNLPDATRWPVTRHGTIHQWAAFATFMGTIIAMLVQSWRLRLDPRWRQQFASAITIAMVAFVCFWVFALVVLWLWRAAWQLVRAG